MNSVFEVHCILIGIVSFSPFFTYVVMVVKVRYWCRLVVFTVSVTSTALLVHLFFEAIPYQTSQGAKYLRNII